MTRLRLSLTVALLAAMLTGCAANHSAPAEIGLRVGGQPFFPLMNFYQSPQSFDNAVSMGLNAYFMPGNKPPPKEYLDLLHEKGLYGIVPFDEATVGHPALLAWVQPHEPEKQFLAGKAEMSPESMLAAYRRCKEADPSRPVVLDFAPTFMTALELGKDMSPEKKREIYPAYARAADIVTYNVYPVWGHNRPDKLDWVAEAADDLKALVGSDKPFFAMIETTTGWREIPPEEQKPLSHQDVRAEVWMAVIRGATGVIYFTHRFKPTFSEHGLDAERHAAIKAVNERLTRLAPAILAAPAGVAVRMTMAGDLPCHLKATKHQGAVYVFAQNIDMKRRTGKATFTVAGLKAATAIEVIDENRTLTAGDGTFTDEFGPLAEHVYRLEL